MNTEKELVRLKTEANKGWNTWNTQSVLSHVLLPHGIAVNLSLKDYSEAQVLREPLIGREGKNEETVTPGIRSWRGEYTSLNIKYGQSEFNVESTADDEDVFILVSPLRHGVKIPMLIVEECLLWGREGMLGKTDGKLWAEARGRRVEVFVTSDDEPEVSNYAYSGSLSPSCAYLLDRELLVSTKKCTLTEAHEKLRAAHEKNIADSLRYGNDADDYIAMKSCLAWDTIYDPEKDRIISTVSRIWNKRWGGYVLFEWDTYFGALMAAADDRVLAYSNALAITEEATERGFIPNFACNDNFKSRDRSQPPVGSLVCLEIYKRYGEKWFLDAVFDNLLSQNEWFFAHRRSADGYFCWGSEKYEPVCGRPYEYHMTTSRVGASLESGLDNSPMYDGAGYDPATSLMTLADVGLTGMYIGDCGALLEMAEALGRDDAIHGLKERLDSAERSLASLWDDENSVFANLDLTTREFGKRITPTCFYALFSSKVTPEQTSRMLEGYFYSPNHFWGEWMLPAISRIDPAYPEQEYWRGRIWAPLNLLVYLAMKKHGLTKEAAIIADKSRALILKEWYEHGHVHENYNADTGDGCGPTRSDKFYHWGGLLAYISIDNGGYAPQN